MLRDLYWPAAVLLMAWAQGWLMPAIRRTPPGAEARRQAFALHWLLTALYFGALVFQPKAWLVAVLARLLLFDPVLNYAAGDKVFAVGQTAFTDRAISGLAVKLNMQPEHLRAGLWMVCLLVAGVLLGIYT